MNLTTAFRWLVVAVLAVSLPAIAAPEKKFSVAMSPNVVGVGSVSLTATIKNETPNGNSSINSLKLTLPTGYTIDSSVPPTANWPGQVTYTPANVSPAVISISNMSPLKPLDSFVLTMRVNVAAPPATTCAIDTWNAQAWTGSSFSGDTFRQLFPPEFQVNSTTTIATGFVMSVQQQPSNVAKGVAITPAVAIQLANSCGPVNGTVTITDSGGTCTTANGCLSGNVAASSGGVATFPSLKINTPGNYTLSAGASGFTSINLSSITVFDGILKCQPGDPFVFNSSPSGVTNVNQPGFAEGQRGMYNKDGSACSPVGYTFTNNILSPNPAIDNSVTLNWDTAFQPGAAFKYTLTWKPEYVNPTTGLPARVTRVQWVGPGGVPTPSLPVAARACLSSKLPEPYGTLPVGGINDMQLSFNVTVTGTLPPVPFPITIDSERMTVTSVMGGTTFNVLSRGAAGAGGTIASAHAGGKYVMSNPLPLDASNKQMQMCLVEEGWTAYPAGTPDCTPADSTNACVLPSTTIMDLGDGFVSRDF